MQVTYRRIVCKFRLLILNIAYSFSVSIHKSFPFPIYYALLVLTLTQYKCFLQLAPIFIPKQIN